MPLLTKKGAALLFLQSGAAFGRKLALIMAQGRVNNGNAAAVSAAAMKTVTFRIQNTQPTAQRVVLYDQTGLAELRSPFSEGDVVKTVNGQTQKYDGIVDWLSGLRRINVRELRLIVVDGATPVAQLNNEIEAWRATPWNSATAIDMKIIRGQWPGNQRDNIVVFNTDFWVDNATMITWMIEPNSTVDFSTTFPYGN